MKCDIGISMVIIAYRWMKYRQVKRIRPYLLLRVGQQVDCCSMESLELPQMDPRVLKATSVKAEDPAAPSPEPQALKSQYRAPGA